MAGIREALHGVYQEDFPELYEERRELIYQAIEAVQAIYRRTIFPEMGARWAAYPDNIGHRDWPGCFRCHNDRLESGTGETIFTTCNKCHIILAQGEDVDEVNVNFHEGLEFVHPDEDEVIEEYTQCTDCHDGGLGVY